MLLLLLVCLLHADPVYWSCVKVMISQVHDMKEYSALPEAYHIGCHPVAKVEVVGTIVSVLIRASMVCYSSQLLFSLHSSEGRSLAVALSASDSAHDCLLSFPVSPSLVDDGTGILHCNCWYNQNAVFSTNNNGAAGGVQSSATMNALSPMNVALYRQTPSRSQGFVSTPFSTLAMGNVVRVRGKISVYAGARNLSVEALYVESEDPHAEVLHWIEAMHLYNTVYSQPSAIFLETQLQHTASATPLASACLEYAKRKAQTAAATAANEEDSTKATFTAEELIARPELEAIAKKQAEAILQQRHGNALPVSVASTAASSSSSTSTADITPVQCMQSALDLLMQMSSILQSVTSWSRCD